MIRLDATCGELLAERPETKKSHFFSKKWPENLVDSEIVTNFASQKGNKPTQ